MVAMEAGCYPRTLLSDANLMKRALTEERPWRSSGQVGACHVHEAWLVSLELVSLLDTLLRLQRISRAAGRGNRPSGWLGGRRG